MPKHFTLKLLCGMLVISRNRDGCLVPPMDPAERSICWDCAPEPVPICVSPSNLPAVWTRSPLDLLGSDLSGRSLLENCQDKEFFCPKGFDPILKAQFSFLWGKLSMCTSVVVRSGRRAICGKWMRRDIGMWAPVCLCVLPRLLWV